jgi:hypothetical protein
MYQPFAGFWSCYKCAAGKFAQEYGAKKCSTCNQCARGRFGTTPTDSATSSAQCSCKQCGTGKYAPAGYDKCFSCPVGRFQPPEGKERFTCYYCVPGQYQDHESSSGCKVCPSGKSTHARGADSLAKCITGAVPKNHGAVGTAGCALGSYQAVANLGDGVQQTAVCQTCPAGYFGKMVTGYGGHCFQCPDGTYQPNRAQTSCLPCSVGAGAPVGFAPNKARTRCMLAFCPAGQAKTHDAGTGEMKCAKCSAGQYETGGMCQLCAENTFSGTSGATACAPCGAGLVANLGASQCTQTRAATDAPTPAPTPRYFQPGASVTLQLANVTLAQMQSKQLVLEAALANLFTWDIHNIRIDRFSAATPPVGRGCEILTLSGFADNAQKKRLGDFYATADNVEGRPVYVNRATGDYLYYYPQKEWWLIGPTVGSSTAGMLVQDKAMHPADIKGQFYAFDSASGQWTKTQVDQMCARMPLLDVRFSLLAHDCSAVDAKKIENAPRAIHQHADRLAKTLDQSGLATSGAKVLGKVDVRGCEPEIILNLGAPTSAVAVPHCHFDGNKVTIRHTQQTHTHDSFACNHRFSAAASAWQCTCKSWKASDVPAAPVPAAPKGKPAAVPAQTYEDKAADVKSVPAPVVDCKLSGLPTPWTPCDKECMGEQTRSHSIVRHALNGGKACPDSTEKRACNTVCDVDCKLAAWGEWGQCSKTCGGGIATRKRAVEHAATGTGKPCTELSETVKCATEKCQVHYVPEQHRLRTDPYNSWWQADNKQDKALPKYVSHLPVTGCCIACTTGAPCGEACIDEDARCDKNPSYDHWCACHADVHAEVEKMKTARMVQALAKHICQPGQHVVNTLPNLCAECPVGTFQSKQHQPTCLKCPIGQQPNLLGGATGCVDKPSTTAPTEAALDVSDCVVGKWPFKIVDGKKVSLWTPCTARCGAGSQYRERHFVQPINGGKACPHAKAIRTCNTSPCAEGTTDATDPDTDTSAYNEYVHSREENAIASNGNKKNLFYSSAEAP